MHANVIISYFTVAIMNKIADYNPICNCCRLSFIGPTLPSKPSIDKY